MADLANKKPTSLTDDVRLNNIINRIYDDLNEIIESVNSKEDKELTVDVIPNWTEVSAFKNDWENYGGSTTTTAYYLYNKRVYLKGQVKTGSAGSNSVIFTLPSDYSPEATNIFSVIVSGSTIGRIHVRKNGDVVAFSDNDTTKATKLITLDGISFKTRE